MRESHQTTLTERRDERTEALKLGSHNSLALHRMKLKNRIVKRNEIKKRRLLSRRGLL